MLDIFILDFIAILFRISLRFREFPSNAQFFLANARWQRGFPHCHLAPIRRVSARARFCFCARHDHQTADLALRLFAVQSDRMGLATLVK